MQAKIINIGELLAIQTANYNIIIVGKSLVVQSLDGEYCSGTFSNPQTAIESVMMAEEMMGESLDEFVLT